MKNKVTRLLLITLVMSFLLISSFSQAATIDPATEIQEKTGINPEAIQDIPKTTEEIKDQYLKQQWSELVAKNKILGPIHSFLLKISPVFLILFGENYSLSLTLLGVICLWFFVAMESNILIESIGTLNSWACKGIAVGTSIILAQIGVYRLIITSIGSIVYARELWWMRLMIFIAVIVGAIILHYITKLIEKQLKLSKSNAKSKKLENKVENQEEFIKGIKEGASLVK